MLSETGDSIGWVTSGGFGPSLGAPVAMGLTTDPHLVAGSPVKVDLRGKPVDAQIVALPMVKTGYVRRSSAL